MTKTENFQLPQWEAGDPVRREDFNRAMERIDEGLTASSCVIGSYVGTGTSMGDGGQVIDLGFRPRFLIISHGWTDPNHAPPTLMIVGQAGAADVSGFLTLEDNGFRVGLLSTSYFKLNTANMVYDYITFK